MPAAKKRPVHFVLSTHWDREWREPFQGLRFDLVKLMDVTLAALADGRMKGPFHTDGQSIVLDDYLQIRPERRAEIEELARRGRLVVGPWYVMPDEFTVSGESLTRNLLIGRKIARAYGAVPSNAGYVPDMFGHNSQMPQIFAICGIKGGFIWRGINNVAQRDFIWRGADGTELPCHKFGKQGYGTFGHQVGRRHEFDHHVEDNPERFAQLLTKYLDEEAAATEIDPILVLEGGDHQQWNPRVYQLFFDVVARSRKFSAEHVSMEDHLHALLAQRDRITTVLEGELREPGKVVPTMDDMLATCGQWVIPGVGSSRVRLKQANALCESLLCQWAEPFSAFAQRAVGLAYPEGFLDFAWRTVLENHAHDSIDGCSLDQVHKDMDHRFDQCRLVAEKITLDATRRLAASVEGDLTADELRVTIFNPVATEFDGVTELTLEIPPHWPVFNEFFGFEPKPGFRIFDTDGREAPYQRLSQAMNRVRPRIREIKWPEAVFSNHVGVALKVKVPAVGYTTLTVRSVKAQQPTRYPDFPSMVTSERSFANEVIDVRVESNGSLTLTDKRTGRVYSRLLTFEDRADIGDGWYHGTAVNDQIFASTASAAEVAVVHDGPLLATLRVRVTMRVPKEFAFDRMARSAEFSDLVIDNLVSLRPGQDYLEVKTTVHNTIDDHRVRVLFPTSIKADSYLTDTAFDVVERPIALAKDNHEYRELEVESKPQQTWTAIHEARAGLAVVSSALLETAVRDQAERPIALTLFRGTRRTIFTDGETGGQVRGPLHFHYFVVPLTGAPDRAKLCRHGQRIAGGLRAVQLRAEDAAIFRSEKRLARTAGLFRVTGDVVVTSAQDKAGALEVRLFNPSTKKASATLESTSGKIARAETVDAESHVLGSLSAKGSRVELTLKPKQILTVRLS